MAGVSSRPRCHPLAAKAPNTSATCSVLSACICPDFRFVASEDDYIGYLAQTELANVVPVTLAAKLRRSHLLFIAYPVVEWSLRVFLHRVFGDQPISYRSWAVLPGAQAIQQEYWRQRGVDLYDVTLEDFVADLGRRLAEVAPV